MQFADKEMQVADAAAPGVLLTGDLPVMLEYLM